VANYIYSSSTANNNLRKHLYKHHAEEYDKTVMGNHWKYKLSTRSNDSAFRKNAGGVRDRVLSHFSLAAFLDHLIRFIVSDDQ
jgi:hypothetical protein